jgi:hypothetical protein
VPHSSSGVLVVVPCGKSKIWKREPGRGAVPVAEAYTGELFRRNRRYAEQFGDAWVVLSAKYGFIAPDFKIPGPYDVTFKDQSTQPIPITALRDQVKAQDLSQYAVVIGLGGKEYRAAIEEAFAGTPARIVFPFAGLPLGLLLRATQQATDSGDPGFAMEQDGHEHSR